MNTIDKIIERECKGFIGDETAACYTAKDLRALLQEVTDEDGKDGERLDYVLSMLDPSHKAAERDWLLMDQFFKGLKGREAIDAAIAAEGK